jgi:hypothetical protein
VGQVCAAEEAEIRIAAVAATAWPNLRNRGARAPRALVPAVTGPTPSRAT